MKTTSILINAISLFAALSIAMPAPIPATLDNLPTAALEDRQAVPTASVELETESDNYVQEDVPANSSVFRNLRLSKGIVFAVAGATGIAANRVSCSAFSDTAGKNEVVPGSATTVKDLILTKDRATPVSIGSILCKIAKDYDTPANYSLFLTSWIRPAP